MRSAVWERYEFGTANRVMLVRRVRSSAKLDGEDWRRALKSESSGKVERRAVMLRADVEIGIIIRIRHAKIPGV